MKRRKRIDIKYNEDLKPVVSEIKTLLGGSKTKVTLFSRLMLIENIYAETEKYKNVINILTDKNADFKEYLFSPLMNLDSTPLTPIQ
ncbi:hypothetical protein KZ483_21210 [Paenibacillus sp. sptzw28]|uniref:hypothetical protein n=1 Tax=Paenibacillus sp. sptzw28 TaxID=715179 RepID=UPI001C6DF67E|nr:hypothetical protein [Paenibacillus sp. sptzw28]QYR20317.1 hypothetical protein KZ483_21210 [Paenibacillus sp. sptzw28]